MPGGWFLRNLRGVELKRYMRGVGLRSKTFVNWRLLHFLMDRVRVDEECLGNLRI